MPFVFDREPYLLTPRPTFRAADAVPTFVYIMRCDRFIKVGISAEIERRLTGLQGANPFKVTLARKYYFDNRQYAAIAERTCHAVFAEARVYGEWFDVPYSVAFPFVTKVVNATKLLPSIHLRQDVADQLAREARYETDARYRAKVDAERQYGQRFVKHYDAKRAAISAAEYEFERNYSDTTP